MAIGPVQLMVLGFKSRSRPCWRKDCQCAGYARSAPGRRPRPMRQARRLADRLVNPALRPDGCSPPYEQGLHLQPAPPATAWPWSHSEAISDSRAIARRAENGHRDSRRATGYALRGLAADLVAERRKVAELRREIAGLKAQLASVAAALREDVA
jgi:hypothetical protein